ncbi:hypothetical protein N4T77_01820 [Clostridium sp. CX1]|uniref:hypothetical protein n=1 Tax=Clostridium sp. CX1 TaxID=2978346 RepID=UPI0021BE0475|nr:hypothetical protein [Clostridium sp. CX1]MCT8975327.1 hypothetical protein [Clostridium sp. CX1]
MNTIRKVYIIKELAQEFINPPIFEKEGEDTVLKFDYESDNGKYEVTGIVFNNCINYRYGKEENLTKEDVFAYNAIVTVENSEWIKDVVENKIKNKYNHYKIYFDGFGVYEFISQGYSKLK